MLFTLHFHIIGELGLNERRTSESGLFNVFLRKGGKLIWLLSAAGCSIAVALILKVNEERGGNRLLLIGSNYIVASLLSVILLKGKIYWPGIKTFSLGVGAGINFVLGFLLMLSGISRGPLAVPVTVMRLSVVVPIMASILLWSEHPGVYQWCGIGLGIIAIILFGSGLSRDNSRRGAGEGYWLVIVSLFFVMGAGDLLLKAFRELSPGTERLLFTWILFTVAAVIVWILVLVRRIHFDCGTLMRGLFLGVPNLFSTVFVLKALQAIPASRVFPFVILGSTLIGLVVWKERLGRVATAGLVLAAIAVVLLPL